MSRPSRALSWTASVAATLALSTTPALADVTKAQCIDANGKGQELRRDGKLSGAREQFRQCADASCPAMVRDDCTKRLDDLESAQPTIIFEAKDGAGNYLSAVKITVDGLPLAERLAGTPLSVDPGEHTFTFETAGQTAVTKKLMIQQAQKDRQETVTFGAATTVTTVPSPSSGPQTTAAALPSSAPTQPVTEEGHGLGTQKILAIVAGGIGVVGLGLGTAFGAMALSKKSDAQGACPGSQCPTHDGVSKWSDATSTGNVSTIGLIVGGVGVAGAAVLWFTASSPSSETSTHVGIGPGVLEVKGTW